MDKPPEKIQCPFCSGQVFSEIAIPELDVYGVAHTLPHCDEFTNCGDPVAFLEIAQDVAKQRPL